MQKVNWKNKMDNAIVGGSAISANWVLVGVMTLFCILLWRMLTTMQSEIKTLQESKNDHSTRIAIVESEKRFAAEMAKHIVETINNK